MAIPTIPGNVVPHRSDQENWLKAEVARLCQLDHQRWAINPGYFMSNRDTGINSVVNLSRFPGSQPVSFAERDLSQLERQEYVWLWLFHLKDKGA